MSKEGSKVTTSSPSLSNDCIIANIASVAPTVTVISDAGWMVRFTRGP